MLYAPLDLFGVATVGGLGAGQAPAVRRASKEAGEDQAVRGSRFVRYWLDNARPSRAPQGHAGLVG